MRFQCLLCAKSGHRGSWNLDSLDIGFGAESERLDERYVMTARRDVVIMHGETHVVDATFLDGLVVVIRQAERPNDNDAPLAILPAGDGIIVGCRTGGVLSAYHVVGNKVAFFPTCIGVKRY